MRVLSRFLTGLVALAGLSVAALNAPAAELQKQLTSESVIETIMKRGKMKVGMSTFVPWAMRKQGR